MMIWLCVYYEFYCTKVNAIRQLQVKIITIIQKQSPELIAFFNETQEDLRFPEGHLNILNCFLDPTKMIKEKEVPNPLNLNAEVLEYTEEGDIIPKQSSSDEPKTDPIWDLFNPDGGISVCSKLVINSWWHHFRSL